MAKVYLISCGDVGVDRDFQARDQQVLAKPIEVGDFVQVAFQTSQGAVRGMAEILQLTRKSTLGCLQPFRFVTLDDEDHARLCRVMELQVDKTMIGDHSRADCDSN
jgi:hypothetical protein